MTVTYPLLFIGCLSLLILRNIFRKQERKLPPGPPGLPIVGNFFDIPRGGPQWLIYEAWGKTYSTLNFYRC